MDLVAEAVARIRSGNDAVREVVRAELIAAINAPGGKAVRESLDSARRGELLEVQWEIEEVLEATAPPKADTPTPPPPPPPEPEDPNRPLTSKDLVVVYDDPRGLLLHKSKLGERWFATQADPQTGQPQTFELHPQQVGQLKTQLAGSPYWVLGAGGVAAPAAPAAKPPGPAVR